MELEVREPQIVGGVDVGHHPLTSISLTDGDEYNKLMATTNERIPIIVQFTSPKCKRCGILKAEIASRFSDTDDLRWAIVDVFESVDLQMRFDVLKLPRFDVLCHGRVMKSLEAFDANIEKLEMAVEEARKPAPVLEMTDDF